ncbi:hypothetical protein EDB89DRAFT_1905759 [Lactarius sanguifluus]|nr:hypothetical protein EDB89DRAFT_1905759 [Lactarius sanguifluus]
MGTQSHSLVFLPGHGFGEPLSSIYFPSGGPLTILSDSTSDAASHIRNIAQGPRKKKRNVRARGESHRRETTISMLPDNVLLEIFELCRKAYHSGLLTPYGTAWARKWHLLVHVCQRWRQIIFGSPHRLCLRILCTYGTPVRKNLCIWPAFPIAIDYGKYRRSILPIYDNIIAALEYPERVSHLSLNVTGSQLDKIVTMMQESFPVLGHLRIHSEDGNAPVLPAEFLGGSAPRLQFIELNCIPFPALPTLLLSATDLVSLHLSKIPPTGHFSPKAMVACLAVLPRLKSIVIEFQLATLRPDQISPPPVTRIVLPALTFFGFKGASEYLENLLSQIDSPQLDRIWIDYLNQLVDFQVAQFSEFIDRSFGHKLTLLRHAGVTFSRDRVSFGEPYNILHARTSVSCQGIDWQVSHIAQVLSHVSVKLSNVVHLTLDVVGTYLEQVEGTDDVEWQHLLRQFPKVQTLHVSRRLAEHVALALEDGTGEMAAEVLPSLNLIYLAGQPASSIRKFLAARQLSDRPLTVLNTKMEFDERLKSYVSE